MSKVILENNQIVNKSVLDNPLKEVFNKKALMPYITAGDPDLETTKEIILRLDKCGADIIEVGIPFSDPLADGPVIQKAALRSLESGTSLAKIFEMLKSIKNQVNCPYLLMGYYNPILNYGRDKFIADAIEAGVSGVIIPDLPFDQDIDFYNKLKANNIIPILMVTPVSSEKRLRQIAEISNGFTYCVSLMGTTGTESTALVDIEQYLKKVRKYIDLPLALGFGIDGPEKVKEIIDYTDGIIIGSALVKIIEEYGTDSKLFSTIENFISQIKRVM